MTDNPYQAPVETEPEKKPLTRETLAALIRSFLSEEITAFEFVEAIDEYYQSDDPAIRFVAEVVWHHYDDCDDHRVCLTKAEWNYFQRLLLMLESGCRVETQSTKQWSWTQLVAAVSLSGFAWCAVQLGWGYHLFLLAVPFGAMSMALAQFRRNSQPPDDPLRPIFEPFASISDLEKAYRSSQFRKTRYPITIAGRKMRSEAMERLQLLYLYVIWLITAPLCLFFQMFPETVVRYAAKAT